jgi:hypothetical protein
MRLLGSSVLLALYLIALCRPLAPLLDYQVNRNFFAEVLCINKSNPELNCEGQCALILKLKKAYDDEAKPVATPNSSKLDDYSSVAYISSINNFSNWETIKKLDFPKPAIQTTMKGFLSVISHPPCIA